MPSYRRSESSRRTSSRTSRPTTRRNSARSEKIQSELRKASEKVRSLENVMANRSFSSERRLRHYSKTRENCKNLEELGKRDKLNEREQAKSERYRSELNRISLMMKNKAIQKIRSAKRSGSRSEMRRASESTKAVADAIKSSELRKRSELLNKLASQSRRRQSSTSASGSQTKEFCNKLANYTKSLQQKDMRSSEFNKKYCLVRNYAKKMRQMQNNGKFGDRSRSEMVDNQINKFNKFSSEIKNFHLTRLGELRKSSSERQKRILRSASEAASVLESKSLRSKISGVRKVRELKTPGRKSSTPKRNSRPRTSKMHR